jgi:hypothetical protein
MPYLNSNNVIIRNSNAMDTVKLIDMLSKLGVIKKKKRRATKKTQQPQPEIQETPAQSAQRFLTSRPVISLQQNPDTAKMVDIERIRRETFGHIARLTDTVEQQREDMTQANRMIATQRIKRFQQPTEQEIDDESVNVEGVDAGSAIPSVNDNDMDRHGANDATEEKSNDRLVVYAGENNEGSAANDDDDNGFVDPGQPEMSDESVVTNTADEQQDWLDNASQEDEQTPVEEQLPLDETTREQPQIEEQLPPNESTRNIFDEPEEQLQSAQAQAQAQAQEQINRRERGPGKYDGKAITEALTMLGVSDIAKNKSEINNLGRIELGQLFTELEKQGVRVPFVGTVPEKKERLSRELERIGSNILRKKKND